MPDEQRASVAARLAEDIVSNRDGNAWVGVLGARYVLPVLTATGHHDVALEVATQTDEPSWGYWTDVAEFTALGEHWPADTRSRNHHFFGTIAEWLARRRGRRPDRVRDRLRPVRVQGRRLLSMTGLSQDLRVAVRMLSRRPGFTAAAVLTLALGIGGATTMYGFLQAVARHGRPTVPEPERVARVFTTLSPQATARGPVALEDFRRWREAVRSFESLAAYTQQTLPLQTPDGAEEVVVLSVTPSYLSLLETPPVAGRFFTDEEARASDGRVALLSERAWRSRFGGDPSTLGRRHEVGGKSYVVVGVVSERLGLVMPSTDLFVPLMVREGRASVRVIGRRRGSASWAQVGAEVDAIGVEGGQAGLHVRVLPILD